MQKPPQIKKETKPISKWNCMGETRPETGPNQVNNNSGPSGPLLVRRLDSKVLPHSLFEFKFRFKFFFFFFFGNLGLFLGFLQCGQGFVIIDTNLRFCLCVKFVESMWRLGLRGSESYPERQGVPNCVYYMRTGFCGYGSRCHYNHPHNRAVVKLSSFCCKFMLFLCFFFVFFFF